MGRFLLLRLVTPVLPPLSIFNLDKSSLATRTPLKFQCINYGAELTIFERDRGGFLEKYRLMPSSIAWAILS
jgi:hypothetical protein